LSYAQVRILPIKSYTYSFRHVEPCQFSFFPAILSRKTDRTLEQEGNELFGER